MIIIIKKEKEPIQSIQSFLYKYNISFQTQEQKECYIIEILQKNLPFDEKVLSSWEGVLSIVNENHSIYLWQKTANQKNTSIHLESLNIDSKHICIIAGPCSIESKEQLEQITSHLVSNHCNILRAGAFKPRTSPYDFQGLQKEGIFLLKEMKEKYHIPVISEITSIEQLELFINDVDIIQVGARNMQNFELLKALGKIDKPILLKRGMGSTIEEWLFSAEYILKGGNKKVILCERGIKTFESNTRYTLDLSAIPVLKKLTHLPVFVDPSHAVGKKDYVESMTLAAIAAGADGIMIEVHANPIFAKSDGLQAIDLKEYDQLIDKSKKVAQAIGKEII